MSEERKTEEVEGFVCWSPDHGFIPVNDEGDIAIVTDAERCEESFMAHPNSSRGKTQRRHGWRIRPCKIVFTDEGER